jgi:hypothetical protein
MSNSFSCKVVHSNFLALGLFVNRHSSDRHFLDLRITE